MFVFGHVFLNKSFDPFTRISSNNARILVANVKTYFIFLSISLSISFLSFSCRLMVLYLYPTLISCDAIRIEIGFSSSWFHYLHTSKVSFWQIGARQHWITFCSRRYQKENFHWREIVFVTIIMDSAADFKPVVRETFIVSWKYVRFSESGYDEWC